MHWSRPATLPPRRRAYARPPRASGGMGTVLANVLLSAVAVLAAAHLLPGVSEDSFGTALTAAIALGLVNAVIRPILLILTLPLNLMTLGLFTLVIIALCVLLVARVVPGFHVSGILSALAFSFLLWVINGFFNSLVR
jgi:putative membrane protein